MKRAIVLIAGLCLGGQVLAAPTQQTVLEHYADLAQAMYQDSLTTAKALQEAVGKLIEQPTEKNLGAARTAWKAARVPYQQTEAYRFGNAIVDNWEGKVNAWPLDEGLIDYVGTSYGSESDENPFYSANIIANKMVMVGGEHIDAGKITMDVLASLQEAGGVEANVAIGYHAIEFLLWGQDLHGTGSGAGERPATDFDTRNCTHGNCDRRAAYLKAATDLLVDDLGWMTRQWGKGGEARTTVAGGGDRGLVTILTGMGSLSYGELAGERMKLGLMLHDPEEEHDCFSDNTHFSHYYDAMGIRNVYTGSYVRVDGTKLTGPSIADLVAAKNADADKALRKGLDATLAKMQVLVDSAEKKGVHYDQLIGEGNKEGNAMVMAAIDSLLNQTKLIEKAVTSLDVSPIEFEGSDSLDNPDSISK
ncbi:MAG: peptidase [Gammaproteobacteria bacterium]|nr:peptidase [Gammaproteobacteria bacterium]